MPRRVRLSLILALMALGPGPGIAWGAAPTISYTVSGTVGDSGWFRSPVTVTWSVDPGGLPLIASAGCEAAARLTRDTAGTTLSCRAENGDGTTTTRTRPIRIDQSPPAVRGAFAARPPDANGWYRAPVAIVWTGADRMSGLAQCTALTYAGPDGPAAPSGSCRDNAGNVSAPVSLPLLYDATSPAVSGVAALGGDTVATVRWHAPPDAVAVTITRSGGRRAEAPGVRYSAAAVPGRAARFEDTGLRNRARYLYTVTVTDAAGNARTVRLRVTPRAWLRAPRRGARLTSPPVLRWQPMRDARYYNVQLYRGARKVLSAWPTAPRLRLDTTWRYAGRVRRLGPGAYRWFVWAGYGRRAERHYGRLLGTRRFAVVRRPT